MNKIELFILAGLRSPASWPSFFSDMTNFDQSNPARRVPEFHLLFLAALADGWEGLAGMLIFRHKTAKTSFKFKYVIASLIWVRLIGISTRQH